MGEKEGEGSSSSSSSSSPSYLWKWRWKNGPLKDNSDPLVDIWHDLLYGEDRPPPKPSDPYKYKDMCDRARAWPRRGCDDYYKDTWRDLRRRGKD